MSRQLLTEILPPGNVDVATSPGAAARGSQAPNADVVADACANPALRVVDLTKSFRSGFARRRLRGIEGVSFTVPRGEVFALLGHNGAGKTTTIGCLLDLVRPYRA